MASFLNGVSSSLSMDKEQLDSVTADKLEYEVDGYAQGNDGHQDGVLLGEKSVGAYDGHCTDTVINMIRQFAQKCSIDVPSFTHRLVEKLKSEDTRGSGATYIRMEVTSDDVLHVEWCGDSVIVVIDSDSNIIWTNEDKIATYEVYKKNRSTEEISYIPHKNWQIDINGQKRQIFTLAPFGVRNDGVFFMGQTHGAYFKVPPEEGKPPDEGAIAMYKCLGHNGKMGVDEDLIKGFVERGMTAVAYSDGVSDVFNPHLESGMIKRLMTDPLNELVGHFTERWHMPHFGVSGPIKGHEFPHGPAGEDGKADDIFITRIRPRNERVTCKETSEDISECVCKACRN